MEPRFRCAKEVLPKDAALFAGILSCEDDDQCMKKENEKFGYYSDLKDLCELNEEMCQTNERKYSDALMKCCKQTCGMCWAEGKQYLMAC